MRGFPYRLSIAKFAMRLRCSVDSAKRWLVTWPAQNIVQVQRSPGGHWSVNLPTGDYSLLKCRIQRALEKIFQRKQSRTAMPFVVASQNAEKTPNESGVNTPWMWQDLDGLFKQLLEETATEMPSAAASPNDRESKIVSDLIQAEDNALRLLVASSVLMHAAIRLQKTDKTLTVSALAQALGMSHASLYRPPFGKSLVQGVLRDAQGGTHYSAAAIKKEAALQDRLHSGRKLDTRKYRDRKPTKDRKKEIKARYFLSWHATNETTARRATLVLIPEIEVDRAVRPSYPKNPLKERLPKYSEVELLSILQWLERNLVMEREILGAVSPKEDGSGYQWYYNEGQYRGETATWVEASSLLLKVFRPERFRRKMVILNPKVDGLYQIPIYLFESFQSTGVQKDPCLLGFH